ncbi:MAG TPA: tRNA epoxyqueuosine(34) reductase QueG [Gemmatimonadaceae bacterium]|nr:tRNA epoxyqueuosine(34) reductase QueG [Gemmatimonadaceae bacterium]
MGDTLEDRTLEHHTLEHRIKATVYGLGFDLCGIAALGPADTSEQFDAWLAAGYHGEMGYLARRRPLTGYSHAIVVTLDYGGKSPDAPVARYARGRDYHDVMIERLLQLHLWLERETGRTIAAKPYVDTGPILERDLARRAGLGWFGKNTMLINPKLGSFFFIGALLVDLELKTDSPFEAERCGTCTRCLEACPTDAFVAPGVMDARRCISYLTIELKGAIPEDLRSRIGNHVYGCDVCQDVCPWNVRFAQELQDAALAPRQEIDAAEMLALDDAGFRERYRGTAVTRAKRHGLARNAAVVLGNRGDKRALPVLERAATQDPEPLVREHAAWAAERVRATASR